MGFQMTQQIYQDNTYRYAWASSDGSYLLTDDPNDPDVGSDRIWTELRPT